MKMRLSYYLGKLRRYGIWLIITLVFVIIYMACGRKKSVQEVDVGGLTTQELPPSEPPAPALWLVVSSQNNSVCNHLAAEFSGWSVVVVGILKIPPYSHSRCHFLEKERKNDAGLSHGYEYAIKHGAEYIYVPSRDVQPEDLHMPRHIYTDELLTAVQASRGKNSSMTENSADTDFFFNANAHFGYNISYQMGSKRTANNYKYFLCQQKTPAIQAGVLLGPVDKQELTKAPSLDPSDVSHYDKTAPAVTVQNGGYIEQTLKGALYRYDAYWALPFVELRPPEESVYFIFVQKMLWLTGNNMLIYAAGVTQTETFNDSGKFKANHVLSEISCQFETFYDCTDKLLSSLVAADLLGKELQTNKFSHWLKNLKDLGYKFPAINMTKAICGTPEQLRFHPRNYSGQIVTKEYKKTPYTPVANSERSRYLYQSKCQGHKPADSVLGSSGQIDFSRPWKQFDDILLVVTFNNPHYESIPYIEILYRSFFPSILYCGPGHPDMEKHSILKDYVFSFVSYGATPKGHAAGSFNYRCTSMAIKMHFDVEGYLVIADDLLVIIHSIHSLLQQAIWFLPQREIRVGEITKLRECRLGMCDFHGHWNWWELYQEQTISVMKYLRDRKHSSPLMHRCQKELVRLNGADIRANGAYSDIYYIPRQKAGDFQTLSDIFLNHSVFLEIAVPTILRCLEVPEEVLPLYGIQNWFESRDTPWIFFTAKALVHKAYLHPVKWGYMEKKSKTFLEFFCKQVVPFLHDRYARINPM